MTFQKDRLKRSDRLLDDKDQGMSRNESEETATSRGVTEADREKSSEKKIGGTNWEKMRWKKREARGKGGHVHVILAKEGRGLKRREKLRPSPIKR